MPQYQPPFEAPRAKIIRAEHHINDLKDLCDDFFAKHYRVVVIDYTCPLPNGIRQREVRTVNKDPLPDRIPLIIGDAIHNLRSALDLLAFHLLRDSGRAEDKIYFPIVRDKVGPKAAEDTIRSAGIDLAGANVVALFKSFEPYKGGHLQLWELHRVDIIDKHRLLLTTENFSQVSRLVLKELDPLNPFTPNYTFMGSNIGTIALPWSARPLPSWAWFPGLPHQVRDLSFTATIFFREGPFARKPVLLTLNSLANNVLSVIESTEALFT
jgi:hypothetical protein